MLQDSEAQHTKILHGLNMWPCFSKSTINGLWSARMLHIPHFWPNNQVHLITSLLTSLINEDKGTEAKPSVWNVKWLLFSDKILQNTELSVWFVLENPPQMSKYSYLWQQNFCNRKKHAKQHKGTDLVSSGKTSQSGNTLELSYGISQALNPGLARVEMINLTLCRNIILWKHIRGMEPMVHRDSASQLVGHEVTK